MGMYSALQTMNKKASMKQLLVVEFITRNSIRVEINADRTLYPDLTRTGCYFPAGEGSRVKAHIILELSAVNLNP